MTIDDAEKEVTEEFSLFGDDWESKYEHLIDMGRHLSPMREEFKDEAHLIQGCQSRAWLHAELKDGKVVFEADSEGLIAKGLIALMVRLLSGHTPSEILQARLGVIDDIGLKEHLAMTRGNGLVSMINQMKKEALELSLH